jgi:AcrR family transcriptional regulator
VGKTGNHSFFINIKKVPLLKIIFYIYFTYQVINKNNERDNLFMVSTEGINQKETYQIIIKTAQHLFMKSGYRAVSTRQISKICGITQPALYHHFKNKKDLYIAVLQDTLHHTKIDLNNVLTSFNTFQDRLFQIGIYFMGHSEIDLSQMFHDIYHELTWEDQKQIQQWWKQGFLMPVVAMINEGISNGEIKDPSALHSDSTEMAYFVLNIIRSILQPPSKTKLIKTEQTEIAEKKAKLIVEILLNGIGNESI